MTTTALFYLVVYTAGLVRALSGKPIWGLYMYFFAFYFHAPSQWWGQALPELRWSLIAAIVTLISLLINPPKEGFRFWTFRENRFLTFLAALVVAQMYFALNVNVHSEYAFLIVKFMLFIFLFQNTVRTLKDVKGIIWINMLCGCYLAYLGMSMHSGGRLEGIGTPGMESANQLGQHFSVLIFIGGYYLLGKINKWHILMAFCLAMCLMALFMTESRGVILAIGATGILALYFMPKGSKKKISVFGILAIFAASSLMGPQIIERFQGMKTDEDGEVEDASARSRVVIIESQIEMWKDSPIVGYGHAGTFLLSKEYIPEDYHASNANGRASHNIVMAMLVDHGALGAGLYFIAIFTCVWRIWKVKNKPKGMTDEQAEEYRVVSNLTVGAALALVCFMIGGLGSNNKKLEADIWMLALVPVLHRRLVEIEKEVALNKKEAVHVEEQS